MSRKLVAFDIENIYNEESLRFTSECFSAINTAVEHTLIVVPEWTKEEVQYRKRIVSIDLVAEFFHRIKNKTANYQKET